VPQQSAFAATTPAHDDQRLTSMDVEGNVIEHCAVAESTNEMVYFDDCGVSGHDENDEIRMTNAFTS
jgi:hypothetical protein